MLDYYSLLGVWYTPAILRRITVFAVVILVAALGLMAWYLTEVVTKHQGFYPIETSNPVRAVMSLMNVKWSVTLLALSVSLRRRLLGGPAAYRSLSGRGSDTGQVAAPGEWVSWRRPAVE
ncbi:hypothetical protein FJT64_002557 [Amphibalanus amphitrite]|uniref:Uncharacterized protein n=1 Tax=Amphibalanus amphitrite TaxID=1232801 RepID=A0A6A4WDA2_AMPAM|nr:hypothetical protein FJT64_002557 [Amphibalanus amphitrite]